MLTKIKQALRLAFSTKGWKSIITWKDENGNFSWQQVWSTIIQLLAFVVVYLIYELFPAIKSLFG